ncbi:hypothetical protein J4218_00520 [Candidatus Pacearchaeota archaeon]|nr:hypothetical protein [Candidatus Pacearchaeota archaeon]
MEKIEQKILEQFLYNNRLKFNEIEKLIKIRSNKLAYHIKNLIKKGILIKNKEYSLSETAEHLIPYLSDKKAVLPVILIHIGNKNQCFLYKRKKRPFQNYLSMPGGRFLIKESIPEATKRIMQKFLINAKFKKINSITLEHVGTSKTKVHSFLLIFVSATTKNKIQLTEIKKNKSKIISSDYQILINNLNQEIKINTIYSKA